MSTMNADELCNTIERLIDAVDAEAAGLAYVRAVRVLRPEIMSDPAQAFDWGFDYGWSAALKTLRAQLEPRT